MAEQTPRDESADRPAVDPDAPTEEQPPPVEAPPPPPPPRREPGWVGNAARSRAVQLVAVGLAGFLLGGLAVAALDVLDDRGDREDRVRVVRGPHGPLWDGPYEYYYEPPPWKRKFPREGHPPPRVVVPPERPTPSPTGS